MSFFDEADEPRTASRPAPRRRGSTGSRRPPSGDAQAIRVRQAVAVAVLIVLIVLVVLGVHSCTVNARNSALQDYNARVASVIQQSNATGRTFFSVLSGGGGAHSEQTSLNQASDTAAQQYSQAKGFSVPDQVRQAQTYLLLTLQMRRDALANVAANIQPALGSSTSRDAVNAIAGEMARLYASDAVYKDYTVPLVLGALKSAGIAVGGANGAQVEPGQFLPDIRWVTPSFVATQLHAVYQSPTTTAKPSPGPHGHALNSVSVSGTTLTPGASSTLPASPPPTFTLNFTNTGQSQESNVVCRVTVGSTPVSGQTVVPQTTPGQQSSCNVALGTSPPSGTYTVTATIERVPGEVSVVRNSQTFQITFK